MLRMETEIRSCASEEDALYLTYGELYRMFQEMYPGIKPIDYRPADNVFTAGKVGIVIWTDNGDLLIYCPNLVRKESKGDKNS